MVDLGQQLMGERVARGGSGRVAQPSRAVQRAVRRAGQRWGSGGASAARRQPARRAVPPVAEPRRAFLQRQAVQQRRAVQPQRTRQRVAALPRQLEMLRRQALWQRVWQRTAAKRAARQVETEQEILAREERLRAARAERIRAGLEAPPSYGRAPETYESYVRRRHTEARAATLAVARRTAALDGIWATVLARPLHVSFGSMRRRTAPAPFEPGALAVPLAEPRAEDYQPVDAPLPPWVPGQKAARERARTTAYAAYRQALADYRAAEFDRIRRLSVAKLEHRQREAAATKAVQAHNATVDRLQDGYRGRDASSVEEFARIVLSARSWPEGVVLRWRLRYRPDFGQLDGECVLPGPAVVPAVRRYRYVAAADAIRRQPVPDAERRIRFNRFVGQLAVAALFDLFHALAPDVVDVVHLAGRLDVPGRPYVVSVAAARAEWAAVPVRAEPPAALLRRLDARVSPDPYDAVPVVPWAAF